MRWKLLRRRFSISAPRVIVRSHLPWPLRWAVLALALGFSAALALWAFELGKELAGLDVDARQELATLRAESAQLRQQHDRAQSIANTADSLLKAERVAQDRLAQQVRQLEAEKLALQADLGFFERLMPTAGSGLQVRGLQVEPQTPGRLRYQVLVMQSGKATTEFSGRIELSLSGQLEGRNWALPQAGGPQPLKLKQYARVEGLIDHPDAAVIKSATVRVTDGQGLVLATHTLKF